MIVGSPLTPAELENRFIYLNGTPVGRWVRANYHRFFWAHAKLNIPGDLIGLRTLWSTSEGGGQKQLVDEIGRTVAAGTYPDSVLQAKILGYVEGIAAGLVDLILTLIEESQGVVIVDGNARCVALYVLTSERGTALKQRQIPVVLGGFANMR